MLTNYELSEQDKANKTFQLDLVNQEGIRNGKKYEIPLAWVESFISMVGERKLGSHESILAGYLMFDQETEQKRLFIIGKVMTMANGVFKTEHYNHHLGRSGITKTHETQKDHGDVGDRTLQVFYNDLFDVIDQDIVGTINALRRLHGTRGVWQSYDCPMCGCDFDLEDERMVHIGQQFVCSCETVLEATDELIESFETNGDLMTFPPNPRTASALAAFRKNT